ncbi:hypothetical protein LCGC14_1989200, partial [marine sediment metagenome]
LKGYSKGYKKMASAIGNSQLGFDAYRPIMNGLREGTLAPWQFHIIANSIDNIHNQNARNKITIALGFHGKELTEAAEAAGQDPDRVMRTLLDDLEGISDEKEALAEIMELADVGHINREPASAIASPTLRVWGADHTDADEWIEIGHPAVGAAIGWGSGPLRLGSLVGSADVQLVQGNLVLLQAGASIEGIDIAHLGGGETAGSMVCFIDGRPFKHGYRRYKIRTTEGGDDYAAIREVVYRRYRRAGVDEEIFPDVILIDGGKGQLAAAHEAFDELPSAPATLISLAKREELIYVYGRPGVMRLKRNNPALRLLQTVRDEAHRFAQAYHHVLRRQKTLQRKRPVRKRTRRT